MGNEELFTIRVAQPGDVRRIGELWLAIMHEHERMDDRWRLSPDALKRWETDLRWWIDDNTHRVFVATVSGTLVAFVHAYMWQDLPIYADALEVFVATLYVEPAWRRYGIASALMDHISSWATEIKAVRLRLGILARNGAGTTFWANQGAEELSVFYTIPVKSAPPKPEKKKRRQFGFK